jgi:large conductance mechanosensitive channel
MTQPEPSQKFWYVQGGATRGPVEWAEIVALVDKGVLEPASRVMAVGADDWGTVAQHRGPPATGRRTSILKAPATVKTPAVLKDFTAFLLRGSVVDLAVAVVIGVAFGTVVTALVRDILTPIIAIPGRADFSNLDFTIHGSRFAYGDFINAVISFIAIAAAVFFFVVRPVNALMARRKTAPEVRSQTRECPECLSSIPERARRCAFCTAKVAPVTAPADPQA